MPSTFFGIEIGRSALTASQVGQDVTGHNIANAGTDGYSVQTVSQEASDPLTTANGSSPQQPGLLGTGVEARTVTRARDQYLDAQVRGGLSDQASQNTQRDTLSQVEAAYGEPSDHGLNNALGTFFQNFNELVNNPEDAGVRATVVQGASALAGQFNDVQGRLSGTAQQVGNTITADVGTINAYGQQIAGLNVTIRQAQAQGQNANDLMDRRDVLLDNLAGIANINVVNKSDGTINVAIGTSDLVQGTDANTLALNGPNSLTARGDLTSGSLAGLVQTQTNIQGYQNNLNTLAASLQSQVNAVHSQGAGLDGTTGLAFFQSTPGSEAATLAVNPALVADPRKLAAAAKPSGGGVPPPGDSTVAQQLAALESALGTNGTTAQAFYQQSVSNVGGQSAAAKTAADSAAANVAQLQQQRASVSGVSTDTEMVNMLKYQRAYEAAAKVVKTMDDMIGTLITDLGGAL